MGLTDTIRKLTTVWSFEVEGADTLKKLDDSLSSLKSTATIVGASVAAASASLFGFAEITARAGSAAFRGAQQVGISADAFQRLGFAAEHSGVDAEDLGTTLKILSRQTNEASEGNKEAIKNFIKLGVSIRDHTTGALVSADELLYRISDKFSKMPEGIHKTAMATQFFGRSGNMILPMLNKGRETLEGFGNEAEELGLILDGDAIQAGRKFNRTLKDLHEIALSITYAVGKTLLPVLTGLFQQWKALALLNRQVITDKLVVLTQALGTYLKIVWQFVTAIVGAGQGLIAIFGGWERVIPVVGVLAGIFAGGALLYGIGLVGTAIAGLGSSFIWFGTEALIAWIEATWPVLLLGAAIVGVLLLMEDLYTYFTGGDSVAGAIINSFMAVFDFFETKFDSLGTWVKVFATILLTPFRAVIESIKVIGALAGMVMGKVSVSDVASQMGTALVSTMGMTAQGGFQGNTLSGALGFNPSYSPSGSGGGNSTTNAPVNAPVTVNIGDGAGDPAAIGKQVRDGVSGGISDAQMRAASRTFKGPAATGGW